MTEQPRLHNDTIKSLPEPGEPVTLNQYQTAAQGTAVYPGKGTFWGLVYASLKGSGEVGEFNEKVGKLLRDDKMEPHNHHSMIPSDKRRDLIRELGDELWYLAAKATELNVTLEDVARLNIAKLKDRQNRGTLSGSGDNR